MVEWRCRSQGAVSFRPLTVQGFQGAGVGGFRVLGSRGLMVQVSFYPPTLGTPSGDIL